MYLERDDCLTVKTCGAKRESTYSRLNANSMATIKPSKPLNETLPIQSSFVASRIRNSGITGNIDHKGYLKDDLCARCLK